MLRSVLKAKNSFNLILMFVAEPQIVPHLPKLMLRINFHSLFLTCAPCAIYRDVQAWWNRYFKSPKWWKTVSQVLAPDNYLTPCYTSTIVKEAAASKSGASWESMWSVQSGKSWGFNKEKQPGRLVLWQIRIICH